MYVMRHVFPERQSNDGFIGLYKKRANSVQGGRIIDKVYSVQQPVFETQVLHDYWLGTTRT